MARSILDTLKEEHCSRVGENTAQNLLENSSYLPKEAQVIRVVRWLSETGFSGVDINYFQASPFSLELEARKTGDRECLFLKGFLEEVSNYFSSSLSHPHCGTGEDENCVFKLSSKRKKREEEKAKIK